MVAPAFRMVTLGDSIMWGQGLRESEKFSTQVQQWLETTVGRSVQLDVFAHSRAVIAPDEAHDRQPPKPGEVPDRHPSITAQAACVPHPEDVDLVMIDGGINDMGAQHIVNPLHVTDLNWIRERAFWGCGKMEDLLARAVLPRFTKACVVVTGYYPLISGASDPLRLADLIARLCPEVVGAVSTAIGALLAPLAAQSRAWADASDEALHQAVEAANRKFHESTPQIPPSAPRARAVLARIPFGPEHCYAAPATGLWLLGEEDSVAEQRRGQCRQFAPLDPLCPFEPAFHPNRHGAEVYAKAVTTQLEALIPGWRGSS